MFMYGNTPTNDCWRRINPLLGVPGFRVVGVRVLGLTSPLDAPSRPWCVDRLCTRSNSSFRFKFALSSLFCNSAAAPSRWGRWRSRVGVGTRGEFPVRPAANQGLPGGKIRSAQYSPRYKTCPVQSTVAGVSEHVQRRHRVHQWRGEVSRLRNTSFAAMPQPP